jgi:hypothetical protein
MQYILAPLEEHYDDGFGAVGDAFKSAAEELAKTNSKQRVFWNHLPEVFLVRHAIELFLKSGIIIIHRKLKLPYGAESYSTAKPMFLSPSGAWKPLFGTHSLPDLYSYWKSLVTDHQAALTKLTKRKPDMTVPNQLDGFIHTLGSVDPTSDYFRYPVSKNADADKEKSPFKEIPMEALFANTDNEKVHALVLNNPDGEWVRAFKHDQSTHQDLIDAGWNAVNTLSGYHAMMRIELTDGW